MDFVLGVDLDGVCADFYGRMRELVAEWRDVEVESLPRDVSWGLPEWEVKDLDEYTQIHRWAVRHRDLFRSVKPMPGVRQALRSLSNDGVRIRIITSRLTIKYFHETAVSQTTWWLDHHDIPYRDLCFMDDKALVDAHIYVEDGPAQIRSLHAEGKKVIVFENSTNREEAERADLTATHWSQVEKRVRAEHQGWLAQRERRRAA